LARVSGGSMGLSTLINQTHRGPVVSWRNYQTHHHHHRQLPC
jgi:hypothetical protein